MILTSYQQSYSHFGYLSNDYSMTYPSLYRDVEKLYRTYTRRLNENVPRETLKQENYLITNKNY